ncbi:MAG: putative Ig domain-containing protein, partial [Rubrivivax sp.]|nr:putative Ig domain-containing protein [Rubrivivax sp.]
MTLAILRLRRTLATSILTLAGALALPATAQNVIQSENAKSAGVTTAWQIPDASYASNQEIEGYASATSVNRGESISLFVQTKTTDPSYTINVYRIGWYGGSGGRLVHGPITRTRTAQPSCPMTDADTRLIECNWTNPYVLTVPNTADATDWASGVYLAKLTGASTGKQSYIIFVVRDDPRSARAMFQTSVTTYAAYNNWGGYDFYDTDSLGLNPAHKVSFNRPYRNPQRHLNGKGAGDFLSWEINMLRFVEREGYDVKYSTNIDTHLAPGRLLETRLFLSVGHDEYYTRPMYDALEAARDAGVNLAFIGANAIYWQVRLEPHSQTGQANRTVVGYKYFFDPQGAANPSLTTYLWREAPLNRPEAALIGVMYDYNSLDSDIVIADCSSWVCAGANQLPGNVLPGMLGYEVDRLAPSSPAGITVIAESPYVVNGEVRYSQVTHYTAPSGAGVFATGSMQWTWGLDSFSAGASEHGDRTNAAVQQITRNVLNRFTDVANAMPQITTTPVTTALVGTAYSYDVNASDGNGDTLTYALTQSPSGMTINSGTGVISWLPSAAQAGSQAVTVRVSDPGGLAATQSFTIAVSAANVAPQITTTPVTAAAVGGAYGYDVNATDANGDTLTYALTQAPTGMTINAANGLIAWTPTAAQAGAQAVTVRVSDPGGLAVTQSFTVTVTAGNVAPQITTTAVTTATVGVAYSYDVNASDANGDTLTYSLTQGPAGMTINTTNGLIAWTPTSAQVGSQAVTVRVTDPGGLFVTQSFTITVGAGTAP